MNSKQPKMLNSKSLKLTLKVAIIRPKLSKPEKNHPVKIFLWGIN
jgi:hypothetical protein